MKSSSRLNILILIAFVIIALAYFLYRWASDAQERQKIYGQALPVIAVFRDQDITKANCPSGSNRQSALHMIPPLQRRELPC